MPAHAPAYWVLLFLLGLGVGCAGTLVGAGGGFILMPILVLLCPNDDPALLASISLAVVFANAASGSIAYAVQRRIDYRAGLLFAAAAVPGAVLGAFATGYIPRPAFDVLLGIVLVGASLFLATSGARRVDSAGPEGVAGAVIDPEATRDELSPKSPRIRFAAARGTAISFGVGVLSSLLGIGGGIVHVPALILLLGFPVHVATATSHFVLAVTALAGTAVHVGTGTFVRGWRRAGALGIGVVLGAQVGAQLARRTHPVIVVRALALALVLVGVRIVVAALY